MLDSSTMSDHATHANDERLLHRALELARQGVGLASPNPCVGAVITDAHGEVAGEGTYTYGGIKHAEILALDAAGPRATGGTLYINLEPHAHQGRTPPCTDAVIAAGIRRVVASMPDPNPKVSGRGFEQLRAAGVLVEVGRLAEPARKLNEAFARYVRHGIPLVTLKSAMTLDGKIAPAASARSAGDAERGSPASFTGSWITGEAARAHVHQLRHQHDAILVGAGTVVADNPLLTDRSGLPRRRPLLRVVLDSHLRLSPESRLVESAARDRKDDVLIFCSSLSSGVSSAAKEKKARLERLGVRVEAIPSYSSDNRPDLSAVVRRLGQIEITSVMIEGGSTVNAAALSTKIVDKVFLYYAATILGENSVPFADPRLAPVQMTQVKHVRMHRFGEDIAVEGYLRDPYGE